MNIQGAPDSYSSIFNSIPNIVARDSDNRLLRWWRDRDDVNWKVESLTDIAERTGPGVGQALISGDPHGYSFSYFDVDRRRRWLTQHIVARGLDNRLLEWSREDEEAKWRVVSLTDRAEKVGPGVGDALITGNPHGYEFNLQGDQLGTQHIVARGLDNRLLEWAWNSRDATWRVASLTDRAERVGPGVVTALIAGDPHGYEWGTRGGYNPPTQHIVAQSLDNRLLEWSWSDQDRTWRVVSLTDRAQKVDPQVGNALIGSTPHGYVLTVDVGPRQNTQHIVALSLDENRLLEWSWSSRDATWRVVSLSDERVERIGVERAWILSPPHGYPFTVSNGDVQYTQHIVARSTSNQLLEWFWSSRDATWRVVGLSDRAEKIGPGVGNALIGSAAHGYGLWDEQLIVARSVYPDNRLLVWSWNKREAVWRVEDNLPAPG